MKTLLAALMTVAFSTGAALAQTKDFATVDADANSMISMEEATAAGFTWTEDEFKAADKDGDGSLNVEEFTAAVNM